MIVITVEQPDGTVIGSQPITESGSASITESIDKIGSFSFSMPATSINADMLYPASGVTRYVRIQAFVAGVWSTLGRYIIRSKQKSSNTRMLEASGQDILGELMQTNVGRLTLESGGNPLAAASVLSAVMSGSLPGWTWTGVPSRDVYYKFGDESHFAALTKIAAYCGDHFRGRIIAGVKTLEWRPTSTSLVTGFDAEDSGLLAVDSGDPNQLASNAYVCLVDGGLTLTTDDTDRITRVYPRGEGNSDAVQYITKAQRFGAPTTPTSGTYTDGDYQFVLDVTSPWKSYIRYSPGEPTAYDVIADPKSFRDIAQINTSANDTVSAANALFDVALADLRKRVKAQESFQMQLTKVHRPLLVGQALKLVGNHYVDGYGWFVQNRYVMVLEKKMTFGADGGDPRIDVQVTV